MPIVLHIVDHVLMHVRYPEVNFNFGTLVSYVRYAIDPEDTRSMVMVIV